MAKAKMKHAYLYHDGHGVGVFEETHSKSGARVEWVEVWEKFADCYISQHVPDSARDKDNNGLWRIILSGGLPGLVRKAKHLAVWEDNSSEKTKSMGIRVHSLVVTLKDGDFTVNDIPGVMGSDFHYQGSEFGVSEKFSDVLEKTHWGDKLIAKIHREAKHDVNA